MKLPYGVSDFEKIRLGNYLYVDKTRFIQKIENLNSEYVFFIRPRRFGKSLFLSMLEHYYDMNAKANFDRLFGGLYIGQNPTPLKNSYLVLRLNFSGLSTDNKDNLKKTFNMRVNGEIDNFIVKYKQYFADIPLPEGLGDMSLDANAAIKLLIDAVKRCDKKMYVIIDEYDNFANNIIAMDNGEFYKDIIRVAGFVREFYKTVKIGTESCIDKIFITGISPVMLDDLTSGFNIAKNLTTSVILNEMLGFTQEELRQVVDRIEVCKGKKEIVNELRKYYNGYLFNEDGSERVYNPDMILYFFSEWVDTGSYPKQLVDDNVKTDYGMLERLSGNEENRKILEDIIKDGVISAPIVTKFSFDRMYDREYFVSLLFYLGLLTIKGKEYGTTELVIPNYVIRTVFWEYFDNILKNKFNLIYNYGELGKTIWKMGYEGKIRPFLDFVSYILKTLSNRDLINFSEKYIKMVFFCYAALVDVYNPISEKEVENGYIDVYLERDIRSPNVKYEWMVELKYIKEGDRDKLEQVRQEGVKQLERYAASRGIIGKADIKQALVIFIGKDEYEVVDK